MNDFYFCMFWIMFIAIANSISFYRFEKKLENYEERILTLEKLLKRKESSKIKSEM